MGEGNQNLSPSRSNRGRLEAGMFEDGSPEYTKNRSAGTKPELSSKNGEVDSAPIKKREKKRTLGDEYIEEIGNYYKKCFSEEENIRGVLKGNGLSTFGPWVEKLCDLLEPEELAKECLEYSLERILENNEIEKIENVILADSFDQIREIKEEIEKVIHNYFRDVLESLLENAEGAARKRILTELNKVNKLLGIEPQIESQDEDISRSGSVEEKLPSPEDSEEKIKSLVESELQTISDKLLGEEELQRGGVDINQLKEGIEFILDEEKDKIVEWCTKRKKDFPESFGGTEEEMIKAVEYYVRSAFELYGNDAVREAYKKAFPWEAPVMARRRAKNSVIPKQKADVPAKKEVAAEEIFTSEQLDFLTFATKYLEEYLDKAQKIIKDKEQQVEFNPEDLRVRLTAFLEKLGRAVYKEKKFEKVLSKEFLGKATNYIVRGYSKKIKRKK